MAKEFKPIEVTGATIEKAIAAGLAKLKLSRTEVVVDVVDEGSRGLLGIGSRDAVVRIKPLVAPGAPVETQKETEKKAPPRQQEKPKPVETAAAKPKEKTAVPPPKPAPAKTEVTKAPTAPPTASQRPEKPQPPKPQPKPAAAADDDAEFDSEAEAKLAVEIIEKMVELMQVSAAVTPTRSEPDDLTGEEINVMEITGEDLGVMIGPRGDTLSALQYITRLMVGHQLRQRPQFIVDVEGYRQRREQALIRMAERMAVKAIKRDRPVSLEPMPPNERRIIHMALRENDEVYTQSSGEGKRRRVRIIPKK